MDGWRWNPEKGYHLTGVAAAAEKNREYREQFGLTEEQYHQAMNNPLMALAIIEQLYADPSIRWAEATVRAIADPLIAVVGGTPFDPSADEAVVTDPLEESERLRKLIGEMLFSR